MASTGRARLFEVVQKVKEVNAQRLREAVRTRGAVYKDGHPTFVSSSYDSTTLSTDSSIAVDYLIAPPRMTYYEKVSRQIYGIYLKYIAPEDIVVYSIDEVFIDTTLIDVTKTDTANLTSYDLIIFASGIYFSQFKKRVMTFVKKNLSAGKKTALLYTYGTKRNSYTNKITEAIQQKDSMVTGSYGCLDFDTFGPFKLVGGIAKGHPNADEIVNAVKFIKGLV